MSCETGLLSIGLQFMVQVPKLQCHLVLWIHKDQWLAVLMGLTNLDGRREFCL